MSNPKDELPPPEVPEPERRGLEDALRRFVMGLNYDGGSAVPKLSEEFSLIMRLDGNLVIHHRSPEPIPLGDDIYVDERPVYVVERKTKGKGKYSRPWWSIIRLSDEEELPEMKPHKPVDIDW